MKIFLFNKPFQVLTQFSPVAGKATLADHLHLPGVFPAGRLDYDSEGLLLLSDDGALRAAVTEPGRALEKTYWAQVEGVPDDLALAALERGIRLNDGPTLPARARRIEAPPLWARNPPIRYRAALPTSWIELGIREGRNRQVRRMTAAIGHPTLRLVRAAIGPFTLDALQPGKLREVPADEALAFRERLLGVSPSARAARSASPPRAPARSSAADRPWSGRRARGPRR